MSFSDKFPGDADAVGREPHSENHCTREKKSEGTSDYPITQLPPATTYSQTRFAHIFSPTPLPDYFQENIRNFLILLENISMHNSKTRAIHFPQLFILKMHKRVSILLPRFLLSHRFLALFFFSFFASPANGSKHFIQLLQNLSPKN